jgi:hypothetical protein
MAYLFLGAGAEVIRIAKRLTGEAELRETAEARQGRFQAGRCDR